MSDGTGVFIVFCIFLVWLLFGNGGRTRPRPR